MFGSPRAALTADQQAAVDSYDAYASSPGFTTPDADMVKYRGLFIASPNISAAMDYASLHADLTTGTTGMWSKLDAAEIAGFVADLSDLANYPAPMEFPSTAPTVGFVRAELVASHSAKLAHALFVELNGSFGWSLSGYSEEHLRYLFDTDNLYTNYDLLGDPTAAAHLRFCDHSPKRIYDETITRCGGTSVQSAQLAMNNVDESFIGTFRHSTSGWEDPTNIVDIDDIQILNDFAPGESDQEMFMRQGCQSACYLGAGMARSINIPAVVLNNYFATAVEHKTLALPTIDRVYGHGDDYYSKYHTYHWGVHKCDTWADWQANILIFDPDDEGDRPDLEHETVLRWEQKAASHINDFLQDIFVDPGEGWSNIAASFDEMTQGERDVLYYDLVDLTHSDGGGGP
jgi:hypothetical protein